MLQHRVQVEDVCTPLLRQTSRSEPDFDSDFPTPNASVSEASPPNARGPAPAAAAPAPGGMLSEVPAIVVTAITTGINAVTYGTLCYRVKGLRGAAVPDGVAAWLIGSTTPQLAISFLSGIPFGIGTGTVEMLPVVHAIFESVAVAMPDADVRDVLATCLATVFTGTLSLGVLLFAGGRLGCARWLRAVPVVVLKGALFGVSIFLLQSGIDSSLPSPGADLVQAWPHWALTVLLGALVFALDEALRAPVAIVSVLLLIAAAPQAAAWLGLASLDEPTARAWLLDGPAPGPHGSQGAWYTQLASIYLEAVPRISWTVVLGQGPAIMGLWLTHVLCTLMDLKAIELITHTEIDLDAELCAVGIGNVLSAVTGSGWPIYVLCSQNVTAYKVGGRTRLVGAAKVLLSIPLLSCVQSIVPRLPRALPGCVAFWLGLSFMKETAVDIIRQHSSPLDVGIVACMAVVITWAGLLQGLLVGFLLAMSAFTLRYSGMAPVVRVSEDAAFLHSNVARPRVQTSMLERLGGRIRVVHLEGYIMFGSSPQLVDTVRPLVAPGGPRWVVLSFRGVRGLDYSAICDLVALGRRAGATGCCVVLTELREAVMDALARARVPLPELTPDNAAEGVVGLRLSKHYHPALKCCEDAMLASLPQLASTSSLLAADPAEAVLVETFGDYLDRDREAGLKVLSAAFEREEYQPGATLWEAGEPGEFCFGVVSGELHSMQPVHSSCSELLLMEVAVRGAFLGFAGLLNEQPYVHTVLVPADGDPCTGLVLRRGAFARLSEEHPRVANALLRAFLRRQAYEWRALSRLAAQR